MNELFDSHCHLDHRRMHDDVEVVLERAAQAGVRRMATIGCASSLDDVDSALRLAQRFPDRLVCTVGVHPHEARHLDDALLDALERTAADPLVVAYGEIGLDYHYDFSPRDVQREAFRIQIALARKLDMPVVIHTRNAAEETLRILREENARDVGGIIHCFSEDAAFAKAALDLGFVSSFSGIVTYKSAQAVQEAARKQPLDSLMIETDAPFLAPMPMRGKTNEPAFVSHTCDFIAELRGIDPAALAEATTATTERIYGLR